MVALIGFLMIIVIVALLLKGRMSPIVVLGVIPAIAALILGHSPVDIMGYIADGIKTTTSNGILFIFSVIFFIRHKNTSILSYGGIICNL